CGFATTVTAYQTNQHCQNSFAESLILERASVKDVSASTNAGTISGKFFLTRFKHDIASLIQSTLSLICSFATAMLMLIDLAPLLGCCIALGIEPRYRLRPEINQTI